MNKNNNKDTEQCTLHGVTVCLNDTVYSERAEQNGTVKRIGRDGLLLHFDKKDEFDFEYTYWNEIDVNAR